MPLISKAARGRSFGAATFAAILVISCVGCSATAKPPTGDVKNQATWKMPLDEFYVYSPELDNYAEQLLIENCVESQGYDWPVPWQDTEYPQAEDFNSIGYHLFTTDLAKKWGYHFAPPANEESALLWREFVATTDAYFPNPELDAILLDCTDEVRDKDTDYASTVDGVNYLAGLAMQADQIAISNESVMDATDRWRDCLEPQVDFELPQDPRTEMPPVDARRGWGSSDEQASAKEIVDAVADAQCRESSGLNDVSYEANWAEQEKLVEENRDKLDRIRAAAAERKTYLLTIVAENAPDAP